jgi:hypothetical protein
MATQIKEGDQVRVLRNEVGANRPEAHSRAKHKLLEKGDIITVSKVDGCSIMYKVGTRGGCNYIPIKDVVRISDGGEASNRVWRSIIISGFLVPSVSGFLVACVGMYFYETIRRIHMQSNLIEFLTDPTIFSANKAAYVAVESLIVSTLAFKVLKYFGGGLAAWGDRRRQKRWDLEDRAETRETIAKRRAEENLEAHRRAERLERETKQDEILRIVRAVLQTAPASTPIEIGKPARFIKDSSISARYHENGVTRFAKTGDTIVVENIDGISVKYTSGGNPYYARKDELTGIA